MVTDIASTRTQHLFAQLLRFIIAPLVLFSSGFFTADFLLSGIYTWPRTSRVFVLTLTMMVLAYEFIYKEQRLEPLRRGDRRPLKAVVYSCAVPYVLGVLILLALARVATQAQAVIK